MLLEDEVALVGAPPPLEILVIEHHRPCSQSHCNGHPTREETDAVHDAIDSCYAALRD